MPPYPLIAVDVGNARIKLGLFRSESGGQLPQPETTLRLSGRQPELERIGPWLETAGAETAGGWLLGSVNRPAATRLVDWIRQYRPDDKITLLAAGDLPLRVSLPRPDMVGVDRLLDAVAANHLRRPDRPAVVVDTGTAITVDLVSAEGTFRGGAILPGLAMSARAMHEFTDLLPLIEATELDAPPPVGTSTVEAMRSGLFWSTVGAIRELVELMAGDRADVFLTGGASPPVAEQLGPAARHVPDLTLAGIALTAAAE